MNSGSAIVDRIGQMHFEGNVIPHTWYNNIKMPNGKPDVIGIILLADLVYWYRPTYIRDEMTGQLLGTKKKFKGDLLQKKTQSLADQFGFTKRQVQDALSRLEKGGLITRELRNFNTEMGFLSNVQFIGLIVENIELITFGEGACVKTHEVETYNVRGRAVEEGTYTKITTEITTKNYEEDRPQPQFNLFDEIKMITGKMPSAIQTEEIMRWINALPTEVLQEAVKRTKEATPDNPFRYLKAIISHWQAKGLRTLEAVMQDDIKRQGGNKNAINQGQQLHANDDEQRKLQEKLARIEKIKGHRANNEADF